MLDRGFRSIDFIRFIHYFIESLAVDYCSVFIAAEMESHLIICSAVAISYSLLKVFPCLVVSAEHYFCISHESQNHRIEELVVSLLLIYNRGSHRECEFSILCHAFISKDEIAYLLFDSLLAAFFSCNIHFLRVAHEVKFVQVAISEEESPVGARISDTSLDSLAIVVPCDGRRIFCRCQTVMIACESVLHKWVSLLCESLDFVHFITQ